MRNRLEHTVEHRKSPLQTVALVASVACISSMMLAYEILVTRISSVVFTSQNVFLVLGLSLLGVSIGAVIELLTSPRNGVSRHVAPGILLIATSGVLAALAVLMVRISLIGGVTTFAALIMLPCVVAGYAYSHLFKLRNDLMGGLYAANFIGAAVGAISVPVLLPEFGPIQSILLIALVGSIIGTVSLSPTRSAMQWIGGGVLVLAIGGVFVFNTNDQLIGDVPVGNDPNKDLYRLTALEGGAAEIIESRWSTFGRTDLVSFSADTGVMAIFIDGAAGTNMVRFTGDFNELLGGGAHAVHQFGGLIPLLRLNEDQKDHALIIGPGGGRDVLLTLQAGFKKITAVEVNPQMVDIVKSYREFNGRIYTDYENVEIVVGEGRNYLRNTDSTFDVIMLFMPVTKSSRSLKAFALSENFLFTKEAFAEYRRHLTDEGTLLIMSHSMIEADKILATTVENMVDDGMSVSDAMRHVFVLGSEMMPLIGVQKSPLTPDDSKFVHAFAHSPFFVPQLSFAPGTEPVQSSMSLGTDLGFPMMNKPFIDLAAGNLDLNDFQNLTGFNVRPSTDDSPFFSKYDFDLPEVISRTMFISGGLLLIVLLIPGRRSGISAGLSGPSLLIPLYFSAIGLGYIVVELSLLQRVVLYLGDPSQSLAVLLASLLIGSGIGSFFTRQSGIRTAAWAGVFSFAGALVLYFGMPWLFSSALGTTASGRQLTAAILLFIQGIPMGILFPAGLRMANAALGQPAIAWVWAINGLASVFGSALTIAIAVSWGYSVSLASGAGAYAVASVCLVMMSRDDTPPTGRSQKS